MRPFLSGVSQNALLACAMGEGAMMIPSRCFSSFTCKRSFSFLSRHPVCGGSLLSFFAIRHLRSFSTSLVRCGEEKAPFSSSKASHELTFLEELDHIIASSSAPPSLSTIPAFDAASSGKANGGSESGSAAGGASPPSISLLKKWSNEVCRHYGRRPRLLLSFFQTNPGRGKNGSDLGPFLADVGFDVDISPAGQCSPSTIARLAVEADVHGVLLLHPAYGNASASVDDDHAMRPEKVEAVASSPSNPKLSETPSTTPLKTVEEDLTLLRKGLSEMHAEDISLFYVGEDVKSSRNGTTDKQANSPCANETLPGGASPVWKNEVLHFSSVSSPSLIASTILKFLLERKEEE